jgi:hypothetical protein
LFKGNKKSKRDSHDIEFEKSRMEILKMSRGAAPDREVNPSADMEKSRLDRLKDSYGGDDSRGKQAWEYELDEHRKRKILERRLVAASVFGILGFLMSLALLVWHILDRIMH